MSDEPAGGEPELLAGLVSFLGVTLALPLHGLEFTLLAVVLALLSISWVAAGMNGGLRKRELGKG